MPRFYSDILNVADLNVLGSIAYATRCARRVLPLNPEFSKVAAVASAAERAVTFGELRSRGEQFDDSDLTDVFHILENEIRRTRADRPSYVEALLTSASEVARLAQQTAPFKKNNPGISSRIVMIEALAKSAVLNADRSIAEWVTANALPRAVTMTSPGQSSTPEYIFEDSCRSDLVRLREISNRRMSPEWGLRIDISEAGPLGALWPRGVPEAWPDNLGLFANNRVTLLLNAIVRPYASSTDGDYVNAIAPPFLEILRQIEQEPNFQFEFTRHPRKFEEFIAAAYDRAGYDEVTLTPQRNDGGRDVIAVKKGFGSVRILEQTKAYAAHPQVTHAEVREMLGTLSLDSNASKGIVTTTADFQPGITKNIEIARFMPHRLELKNGSQLRQFLLSLKE